jgi:hypothetical protein
MTYREWLARLARKARAKAAADPQNAARYLDLAQYLERLA